jgi:hypothetical protein
MVLPTAISVSGRLWPCHRDTADVLDWPSILLLWSVVNFRLICLPWRVRRPCPGVGVQYSVPDLLEPVIFFHGRKILSSVPAFQRCTYGHQSCVRALHIDQHRVPLVPSHFRTNLPYLTVKRISVSYELSKLSYHLVSHMGDLYWCFLDFFCRSRRGWLDTHTTGRRYCWHWRHGWGTAAVSEVHGCYMSRRGRRYAGAENPAFRSFQTFEIHSEGCGVMPAPC